MPLDLDCHAKALDEFKSLNPGMNHDWFERCDNAFLFVSLEGIDTHKRLRYRLKSISFLEGSSEYSILIDAGWAWCSCSEEPKYGVRWPGPCTHIGAVRLYQLYEKYLHLKELSAKGQWVREEHG